MVVGHLIGFTRSDFQELHFVQALVDAAVAHQFLVRADFGDAPAVQHHDLVGAADGGKPMRDHDHGAVLHQILQAPSAPALSDSVSRCDVASSRIRIGAFFSSARAMASRWRWPPLSFCPRSPIIVS